MIGFDNSSQKLGRPHKVPGRSAVLDTPVDAKIKLSLRKRDSCRSRVPFPRLNAANYFSLEALGLGNTGAEIGASFHVPSLLTLFSRSSSLPSPVRTVR